MGFSASPSSESVIQSEGEKYTFRFQQIWYSNVAKRLRLLNSFNKKGERKNILSIVFGVLQKFGFYDNLM